MTYWAESNDWERGVSPLEEPSPAPRRVGEKRCRTRIATLGATML